MPIFFDENDLTEEQQARYAWAVAEYQRIQEENRLRLAAEGKAASAHQISPKSALFARLLEGKQPLPYPPPTSYSYPWYAIIETPGPHQVTLSASSNMDDKERETDDCIVLNQCCWRIEQKNAAAAEFLDFLQILDDAMRQASTSLARVQPILARKPEFVVSYGQWGQFRLALGRIVRRGRRESVVRSQFDLHTLDGGNAVIVRVLQEGADMRAKSDATLAQVRQRLDHADAALSAFDQILLASESTIVRAENPEGDDLVEFDCDGWVLQKI